MLLPVILFASLALTQQSQVPAQTSPVAPSGAETRTATLPAVDVAGPEETRVTRICRVEPVTGSRFGRQVCRSSVETADDRRDSQEMLRRMQGSRMPDS